MITRHGKRFDASQLGKSKTGLSEQELSVRIDLYRDAEDTVDHCPICQVEGPVFFAEIYGARYVSCSNCAHVWVRNPPNEDDRRAAQGILHSSIYEDDELYDKRVEMVARPKAIWVHDNVSCRDKTILDYGCGGGHFLYVMKELGWSIYGYEQDDGMREYAKSKLCRISLELPSSKQFNVCSLWGVIEHIPSPVSMIEFFNHCHTLVIAVPNVLSLSTMVQVVLEHHAQGHIVRHMDPLGHLHLFSMQSLSLLLSRFDYHITHRWFFGMDAFEMSKFVDGVDLERMQAIVDKAEVSDEIAVIATKRK